VRTEKNHRNEGNTSISPPAIRAFLKGTREWYLYELYIINDDSENVLCDILPLLFPRSSKPTNVVVSNVNTKSKSFERSAVGPLYWSTLSHQRAVGDMVFDMVIG